MFWLVHRNCNHWFEHMLLNIFRCSSWCSKLNSKDICCCATNRSVTIILKVLLVGRGGGGGLTPLSPNINKQIVQTVLVYTFSERIIREWFVSWSKHLLDCDLFNNSQNLFILWCCDDIRRKSLLVTQSGGRNGFMISEVTLAYVNRDTTAVVSQIKWSQCFKKSVEIIYRFSQG